MQVVGWYAPMVGDVEQLLQELPAAVATEEVGGEETADHDVERVVRAVEAAWTIGSRSRVGGCTSIGPAEAMGQEARQKTAKDTTKLAAEKEWRQQQRRWQR